MRLAGRGTHFYDPSVLVIDSMDDVKQVAHGPHRTWLLITFRQESLEETQKILAWADANSRHETTFRGVIGDGDVEVRLLERP